jgi:DNA gyrase inhibitor GyrI
MVDEITQKHFDKARTRGAPATIAGSTGMVGTYDVAEVRRHTMRALGVELPENFTVAQLREGQEKLAQTAAVQGLKVVEPALIALHADPSEDAPHEWRWQLVLPVRGKATADEDAGITVTRVEGGMYLKTNTSKGFPDLGNLYTYLFGEFLPSFKQQLTRPLIYHRAVDGIESNDPAKLNLAVYVPFYLSLKQPTELVTRETMP